MEHLDIMLLHFSRSFDEWIEAIEKEVLLGHYPNKKYAKLVDSYSQNNSKMSASTYLSDWGFALENKYVIPNIKKKKLKEINQKRKSIMLCSVEEQQRKQIWNFRNGWNIIFFQFFSYSEAYPDAPQDIISKAIESQEVFIEKLKQKYENELLIFDKKKEDYDIIEIR